LPSTSNTTLLRLLLLVLCFLHRLLEFLSLDVQQHPCDEEQRAYDEEQDTGDGDGDAGGFGFEVGHVAVGESSFGREECWVRVVLGERDGFCGCEVVDW
jgi:hypothetical protein